MRKKRKGQEMAERIEIVHLKKEREKKIKYVHLVRI